MRIPTELPTNFERLYVMPKYLSICIKVNFRSPTNTSMKQNFVMPNDSIVHHNATWHPGSVRNAIMDSARKLVESKIPVPPKSFFRKLANEAETLANEAIAEAIASKDETSVALNIKIAHDLFYNLSDDIFLATENANDPIIAQLAAYFLLNAMDGYNKAIYMDAWNGHPDPEWGTIWGIHQRIRDFTPAFIFKVCMHGDVRFLAVECHAPNRHLPDDPRARLRARTMIVSGLPVIAFSPNEIKTDPDACVSEVNEALVTLAEELLSNPQKYDFRPQTGI